MALFDRRAFRLCGRSICTAWVLQDCVFTFRDTIVGQPDDFQKFTSKEIPLATHRKPEKKEATSICVLQFGGPPKQKVVVPLSLYSHLLL